MFIFRNIIYNNNKLKLSISRINFRSFNVNILIFNLFSFSKFFYKNNAVN